MGKKKSKDKSPGPYEVHIHLGENKYIRWCSIKWRKTGYRRELGSATKDSGKTHREGHFETIVGENGGGHCADVWKKGTKSKGL